MTFSKRVITQPVGGEPPIETDFVMTVETTGADETFTLPCQSFGNYDAQIDWGDGSPISQIDTYNDPDLVHTYANAGTHTIRITGELGGINFNNGGDKAKVRTIEAWGEIQFQRLSSAFYGCSNLTKAGTGPIGYQGTVSTIVNIFTDCSGLLLIPDGLFDNILPVSTFNDIFRAAGVTNIPAGLFATITKTNLKFLRAWDGADVRSIPAGLFDGVTTATSQQFDATFRNNANLATVPAGLFDKCVLSTAYNNCFLNCGLTQQSVDNVLVSLDFAGASNGIIGLNGGTNATPGDAGQAAKTNLEDKGWTVNTN